MKKFLRYFSAAVTTFYMIVERLDRLMAATKEVVGEQYYIRGLVVPNREVKDMR